MPDISVVVPSVNGFADLEGCLRSLEAQREDVEIQIVVVDRLGEALRASVRDRFPAVELIEVEADATIPAMRAVGIAACTAPVVGVTEDHVLMRPGWARAMLDAVEEGHPVVGGPVENGATDTVMDWASFLCEYSHCLPPLPEGEVDWLPGNNVVYSRELLEEHRAVLEEHKWENRLHDAIRESGTPLVCRPVVVDHKKHFTFREYLYLRYQYSRSYAGARVRGASPLKRLIYGVGALALPPVLLYRTISRIRSKGRHTEWLAPSVPYIAIFVVAWAWGEAIGALAGAGDSLSKVT